MDKYFQMTQKLLVSLVCTLDILSMCLPVLRKCYQLNKVKEKSTLIQAEKTEMEACFQSERKKLFKQLIRKMWQV